MAHGLLYGASYSNGVLSFTDKQGRTICNADLRKYLTLTATEDNSSVALKKVGTIGNIYKYKLNNGAWTNYELTSNGVPIPLNAGDKVQWRCINRITGASTTNYVQFVMTGKIAASNPVTSIELNLFDPSTPSGYSGGCCYLFSGCTSLVQAPELPATTLDDLCYYGMFQGCTSLVQAPELPATTLDTYCYGDMFKGCVSLAQAPSLPATALKTGCYRSMFQGCTSLTQAPLLPATTLATQCYYQMFYGCANLSEVRTYATNPTTGTTGNVSQWLSGVSATGDFWCDPNVTWVDVPQNWVRRDIADYPDD